QTEIDDVKAKFGIDHFGQGFFDLFVGDNGHWKTLLSRSRRVGAKRRFSPGAQFKSSLRWASVQGRNGPPSGLTGPPPAGSGRRRALRKPPNRARGGKPLGRCRGRPSRRGGRRRQTPRDDAARRQRG